MQSVFITGAPGVGKSTAYSGLAEYGFRPSPNHLTRAPRANELHGFDAFFITEEEFEQNMRAGLYLERTMQEAEHIGVYYGSPRSWLEEADKTSAPFMAMPANTLVLEGLCDELRMRRQRQSVVWANLVAPLDVRRARLEERTHDPEVLERRLTQGVSHGIKPAADLNIDTASHDPSEVVGLILACALSNTEKLAI